MVVRNSDAAHLFVNTTPLKAAGASNSSMTATLQDNNCQLCSMNVMLDTSAAFKSVCV